MALTGKTIGELTALNYTTNNLLLPVEEAGSTYHIAFSGINYSQETYSGLTIASSTGGLVVGQYYLMTDFQTCYDQPNYNNQGTAILIGNYKTGTTEPILLLATSTTGFSPTVYSTLYPKDKISYDFTWNTTEVTASPAKGRITERIDEKNNRADYDFRAVQFIRYQAFLSEDYYIGTVSIDGSGNVVGVGTDFVGSFSVGQILGIYSPNYANLIGGFAYYEVLTITDVTNMTVTGTTFYPESNKFYSRGIGGGIRSPFQCNVQTGSYTGFTEYYTFNANQNFNTYLGDNQNYSNFILSNNVFLNGNYEDMTFGGNVVGNTFDNFMTSTSCGPFFQYNIITNNFDRSTIGPDFTFNFIECDFQGNTVVGNFDYNMLGDNDGLDFDFNQVGWGFRNNFLTFSDSDFINNIIGNDFNQNLIHLSFARNVVGSNFANNTITGAFDDNQIGSGFNTNIIREAFRDNVLEADVYQNNFYGNFEKNTGGPNLYSNNFYHTVVENNLGVRFFSNNVGDSGNIQGFTFEFNSFQGGCSNNTFTGSTQYNKVGFEFDSNTIGTNFFFNQIGDYFTNNIIGNDFGWEGFDYRGNIIGDGFSGNNIGDNFFDNTIGNSFRDNVISGNFINNIISYGMNLTTFADLDSGGICRNNNFTIPEFSQNLTLSGGSGGNPELYNTTTVNVVNSVTDGGSYVTFLSGGTIVAQTTII
jgi:hypothetical protein